MADALLGKLRALESRYNATVDDYDGNQTALNYAHKCAAFDLADLLPQIIAEIESNAKDAARYRWLRGPDQESTRYSRWKVEYWAGAAGWQPMQREPMDSAIDAAKERT